MTGLPRWADVALGLAGLLVTLPLVASAALLIRITSPGPAMFRQVRVGRGGRTFTLLKLRSMRVAQTEARGSSVTVRGDARITPVGRLLRRTKIDELPQLWNVARGELALVGPRPEVPDNVDLKDPLWRTVLSVRPGLTDPVTLRLRGEETLLTELAQLAVARETQTTGDDTETFYRRHLQPWKLRGYAAYLDRRTAWSDIRCLFATILAPLRLSFGFELEPPSAAEILEGPRR